MAGQEKALAEFGIAKRKQGSLLACNADQRGGLERLEKSHLQSRSKILIEHSQLIGSLLKDPSQPPPFSMPSYLLMLHGEAKLIALL